MAAEEGTTLKRVEDKESTLSNLYARMDFDKDLIFKKYVMKNSKGEEIPSVVNVTMNDAKVFANAAVAALISSFMQPLVEGLPEGQNSKVESFLEHNYEQIDERLRGRILYHFVCNHINIRGRLGARIIVRKEGDKYIPDLLTMDSRYLSFEEGPEGVYWYAYRTKRTKMQVKKEYGVDVNSDTIDVVDYWDDAKNETWIEGVLSPRGTVKNPWGYPPVVIQIAPTGFMLLDEGYEEYEGESIFSLDRDLYEEISRSVSIEQTINTKLMLPPYQKETSNMGGKAAPYPDKVGTATEVPINEKYTLLPQADVNNASRMAHTDLMTAVQRGGFSDVDYGNLPFPLSAVAIGDMTEIRNKILVPRLQAIALFYQQLSRMLIKQYIALGADMPVGKTGRKESFTLDDLKNPDEYSINYRFLPKSKRQDLANMAMFISTKGELPRSMRIKEILQAQNPEQVEADLESEEAETLDPAIRFYNIAYGLIVKANNTLDEEESLKYRLQAYMAAQSACNFIRQRRMGQVEDKQPNMTGRANAFASTVFPQLTSGGGASRTGGDQTNNKERYRGSPV